jgi:hypothetical protein
VLGLEVADGQRPDDIPAQRQFRLNPFRSLIGSEGMLGSSPSGAALPETTAMPPRWQAVPWLDDAPTLLELRARRAGGAVEEYMPLLHRRSLRPASTARTTDAPHDVNTVRTSSQPASADIKRRP